MISSVAPVRRGGRTAESNDFRRRSRIENCRSFIAKDQFPKRRRGGAGDGDALLFRRPKAWVGYARVRWPRPTASSSANRAADGGLPSRQAPSGWRRFRQRSWWAGGGKLQHDPDPSPARGGETSSDSPAKSAPPHHAPPLGTLQPESTAISELIPRGRRAKQRNHLAAGMSRSIPKQDVTRRGIAAECQGEIAAEMLKRGNLSNDVPMA